MTDIKLNLNYYREPSIHGRYIAPNHIEKLLKKHQQNFDISVVGKSVLGEDIHFIKVGHGKKRILMWSQMHGNESTTTKAIFDLLNVLYDSNAETVVRLLGSCTIGIIPMLNPDGSKAYTRVNANQVDLNRDAQNLTQPESKVLKRCFEDFRPDFCFNLHGQRTIFSAGLHNNPATVSFLAPSQDEARSVTPTRKKAMDVIVAMNNYLQRQIPGQVGIYDDGFNLNCVGDTFQSLKVPTILFEAGHYKDDYNREQVRALILQSLWVAINEIAFNDIEGMHERDYFKIPQNKKCFYDIIIRNAKVKQNSVLEILDIAVQFDEQLDNDNIVFVPKIEKISNLNEYFGHYEIDANNQLVISEEYDELKEGCAIDFVFINDEKFPLNLKIISL